MTGRKALYAGIIAIFFVAGGLLGALLTMLIQSNAKGTEYPSHYVQALQRSSEAAHALIFGSFATLSDMVGPEGLRIVAFSTVGSAGETVFTKEQVRRFADDPKTYIFGVDPSGSQVIERLPSEFIAEYFGTHSYPLAPQIAINRVLKTGNAVENVLEYYPAPAYTVVDFYYPPTEQGGLDWISLKVVVKNDSEDCDVVALVRGVYTAQ